MEGPDYKQTKGCYASIRNLTPIVTGSTEGFLGVQPQLQESCFEMDSPPPTPSLVEKAAPFVASLKTTLWKTST